MSRVIEQCTFTPSTHSFSLIQYKILLFDRRLKGLIVIAAAS
jgi:hypothetical protein